jgi:hypothetical protein
VIVIHSAITLLNIVCIMSQDQMRLVFKKEAQVVCLLRFLEAIFDLSIIQQSQPTL